MSTNCEHCGYRDNEVKSGSAISEKGKKITLKMEGPEDLSRDILKVGHLLARYWVTDVIPLCLKSETCGLKIPEIDLDLQCGTLGGRFTTVEGILGQIYEELSEVRAVADSDTKSIEEQRTFEDFLKSLKEVRRHRYTFVSPKCLTCLSSARRPKNLLPSSLTILSQIHTCRIYTHLTQIPT